MFLPQSPVLQLSGIFLFSLSVMNHTAHAHFPFYDEKHCTRLLPFGCQLSFKATKHLIIPSLIRFLSLTALCCSVFLSVWYSFCLMLPVTFFIDQICRPQVPAVFVWKSLCFSFIFNFIVWRILVDSFFFFPLHHLKDISPLSSSSHEFWWEAWWILILLLCIHCVLFLWLT